MTPEQKRLGLAVFRRRVDLDMSSRRALAEAAGVGKRTIDAIETGERVSATSMYKVERALAWSPGSAEALLDGGEPTPLDQAEPRPAPEPELSEDEQLEQVLADARASIAAAEETVAQGRRIVAHLEQFRSRRHHAS